MVESSDKKWPTGEGNGKPLRILTLRTPWTVSQFSRSVMYNSLWPSGLQHARPPCPSPTPGACSNSCALNQWCHPTISSSVCEATRANTMTGGPDLSFGFPWNGKIPYPHQAAWSQPINPVRKRESTKGKLKSPGTPKFEEKPVKVWTNKIALQTCNQSA